MKLGLRSWWRWRSFRHPKLSDLLERPTWANHPFSARVGSEPAWYALLVPTSGEGQHVHDDLTAALRRQSADFSVFVAFTDDDPTASHITAAAAKDARIVAVSVPRGEGDWGGMLSALRQALATEERRRGRSVTDSLSVPLPQLFIRR